MSPHIPPISDDSMAKVSLDSLQPNHPRTHDSQLEILAGPMLRYWGMDLEKNEWRGSATYVTRDANSDYANFPQFYLLQKPFNASPTRFAQMEGISFWRYDFDLPMHASESTEIPYVLGKEHPTYTFWVPSQTETMRTMFYSCNGFSLKVDTKQFPGCMWDDVLRKHSESPIHIVLGGGDQLYCDSINLILPENTLKNRGAVPEEEKMRTLINRFYLHQYIDWYGRGYWKGVNGETMQSSWITVLATIPSMNIYDDHDIIDGYGTYRDSTMSSPIFEILGDYAYRYYMYFQQNVSVGIKPNANGSGDAAVTDGSHCDDPKLKDSSWITSSKLGPYIHEPSRSIYARLGRTAAFLGLDCRTERKLDQVCTPDTYQKVFARLRDEISSDPEIKHIYLMLGVPINYPRLVFAENLMSSRLVGPVKWLSKHKIAFKGLVNPFDGDVELLDDLNDHWCAKAHKSERNKFLRQLIDLQKSHSVRVTILSGDVHLCGVGIFRSLKRVSPENDPRFMCCPVSSAIVNTPPPPGLANFLNRRNKNHILHGSTLERMIPVFNADTKGEPRGANKTMMAKRNYCLLDPVSPNDAVLGQTKVAGAAFNVQDKHDKAKHELNVKVVPGSVRMTLNVEVDNASKGAETAPYEVYIPTLEKSHS